MRASWNEFKVALKLANPKLVLGPRINKHGSMVFLRSPGHEDCAPGTELVEIMAIASPAFFDACPCESVGIEDELGKKRYVRGYNSFFRKAAKMVVNGKRLIDRNSVEQYLPSAFKKWNAQKFKNNLMLANAAPITDMKKKSEWLKSRSVPIPGNGMPLGWRSDMRDWEKKALDSSLKRNREELEDNPMGAY